MLERVGSALGRTGASVCDRELPAAFAALVQAHPIVMNSESGRALGWELAHARDGISPGLRERLEFGLGCSEAERVAAHRVFAETQAAFPAAMEGLDVLVTPSAPELFPPCPASMAIRSLRMSRTAGCRRMRMTRCLPMLS